MTTDTPRTDAIEFRHCPPQPDSMLKKHEDAYALSRQLERELAASNAALDQMTEDAVNLKAEVERLKDVVKAQTDELTAVKKSLKNYTTLIEAL